MAQTWIGMGGMTGKLTDDSVNQTIAGSPPSAISTRPMTLVEACRAMFEAIWNENGMGNRNGDRFRSDGQKWWRPCAAVYDAMIAEESNIAGQLLTPQVTNQDLDRLVDEARAMAQRKTWLDEQQRRLGIRHKRYVTGEHNSDWD